MNVLPLPIIFKTEENAGHSPQRVDVIDVDDYKSTEDKILDKIAKWNVKVRDRIKSSVGIECEVTLESLMKWYKETLFEEIFNVEISHRFIVYMEKHLQYFHSYFKELNWIFTDDYLDHMEDILAFYLDCEGKIFIKEKTKQKRNKKRIRKRLLSILRVYLLDQEDRVHHVLMKMRLNLSSQEAKNYLDNVYRVVFSQKPKNKSDAAYCRAFILYQKWKNIHDSSMWNTLDEMLHETYSRSPNSIHSNSLWKEISSNQDSLIEISPNQDSLIEILAQIGENDKIISDMYFRFIKSNVQENLDEQSCSTCDVGRVVENSEYQSLIESCSAVSNNENEVAVKNELSNDSEDDCIIVAEGTYEINPKEVVYEVLDDDEDDDIAEITYLKLSEPLPRIVRSTSNRRKVDEEVSFLDSIDITDNDVNKDSNRAKNTMRINSVPSPVPKLSNSDNDSVKSREILSRKFTRKKETAEQPVDVPVKLNNKSELAESDSVKPIQSFEDIDRLYDIAKVHLDELESTNVHSPHSTYNSFKSTEIRTTKDRTTEERLSGHGSPRSTEHMPSGCRSPRSSDARPNSPKSTEVSSSPRSPEFRLNDFSSSKSPDTNFSGFTTPKSVDLRTSNFNSVKSMDVRSSNLNSPKLTEIRYSGLNSPKQTEVRSSGFSSPKHTEVRSSGFSSPKLIEVKSSSFSAPTLTEVRSSGFSSPKLTEFRSSDISSPKSSEVKSSSVSLAKSTGVKSSDCSSPKSTEVRSSGFSSPKLTEFRSSGFSSPRLTEFRSSDISSPKSPEVKSSSVSSAKSTGVKSSDCSSPKSIEVRSSGFSLPKLTEFRSSGFSSPRLTEFRSSDISSPKSPEVKSSSLSLAKSTGVKSSDCSSPKSTEVRFGDSPLVISRETYISTSSPVISSTCDLNVDHQEEELELIGHHTDSQEKTDEQSMPQIESSCTEVPTQPVVSPPVNSGKQVLSPKKKVRLNGSPVRVKSTKNLEIGAVSSIKTSDTTQIMTSRQLSVTVPRMDVLYTQKVKRLDNEVHLRYNDLKGGLGLDDCFSGDIEKIGPRNVTSIAGFDLYADSQPSENHVVSSSPQNTSSPIEVVSPAYDGIDDFKTYFLNLQETNKTHKHNTRTRDLNIQGKENILDKSDKKKNVLLPTPVAGVKRKRIAFAKEDVVYCVDTNEPVIRTDNVQIQGILKKRTEIPRIPFKHMNLRSLAYYGVRPNDLCLQSKPQVIVERLSEMEIRAWQEKTRKKRSESISSSFLSSKISSTMTLFRVTYDKSTPYLTENDTVHYTVPDDIKWRTQSSQKGKEEGRLGYNGRIPGKRKRESKEEPDEPVIKKRGKRGRPKKKT